MQVLINFNGMDTILLCLAFASKIQIEMKSPKACQKCAYFGMSKTTKADCSSYGLSILYFVIRTKDIWAPQAEVYHSQTHI